MTREHNLLFRTYVPNLITCLEDPDSGVRETAKVTVVELFQYENIFFLFKSYIYTPISNCTTRNAPPRALSDLRKKLQSRNVRKSIMTSIFASLGISSADSDLSTSTLSSKHDTLRPASSFSHRREESQRPNSVLSVRSHSTHDGLGEFPVDSPSYEAFLIIY